MARLARIVLNSTRTDLELSPMTLDLVLDDDLRVVQRFPTCGWWGGLKTSHHFTPFVFFPNGTMDFGTGFEEENRYARTNMQAKRLSVGEYVTVTDADGEHCFIVRQVLWAEDLPLAA